MIHPAQDADAEPRPDPTQEAVRALARAARALERVLDQPNPAGESETLSLAHYRVLTAIAEGDERASRVAIRLAIGKPTISAAVEALTKRGLLVRSSVAGDQRASTLRLTESGWALLGTAERRMTAWLQELSARTPDSDALINSLSRMGAALDEIAQERFANRELLNKQVTP